MKDYSILTSVNISIQYFKTNGICCCYFLYKNRWFNVIFRICFFKERRDQNLFLILTKLLFGGSTFRYDFMRTISILFQQHSNFTSTNIFALLIISIYLSGRYLSYRSDNQYLSFRRRRKRTKAEKEKDKKTGSRFRFRYNV